MRALVLVLALAATACGMHGKPKVERKEARPAALTAAAVDASPGGRVVAPGIVEAWGGDVQVAPQEPGWIAEIRVVEGQTVREGEVLAVLDDAAQRAAVEVAAAEVGESEAALAKALRGPTPEEVRQARAEAEAANARASRAEKERVRTTRLREEGAIAAAEGDRADGDAQALIAEHAAAAAKLAALERGTRIEEKDAAKARVSAARARLAAAHAALARRKVLAPSAGTILTSRAHAGERAEATGALFVLGDVTKVQVRLEVDEIDAFAIAKGAACTLYGDDGAKIAEGSVFRLSPRMGRRALATETPTARADVRVREVFVEASSDALVPGRRAWGHVVSSSVATPSPREAGHVH